MTGPEIADLVVALVAALGALTAYLKGRTAHTAAKAAQTTANAASKLATSNVDTIKPPAPPAV